MQSSTANEALDQVAMPAAFVSTESLGEAAQSNEQTPQRPEERPKERTVAFYRAAVKKNLDPAVHEAYPMRMAWYGACVFLSVGSFLAIVKLELPWFLKLAAGLLIGFCNGLLALISHEVSHGSVVKGQKLQRVLGFFGTLSFMISPTYWKYSHNRLHHGKTQKLIEDPDAFPTMRVFKASKFMQRMFPFTPGSGHKRSYSYLFIWISFHYFISQTYLRFRNRIYDGMDHKAVTLEFVAQGLILLALAIYAGPSNWLWVIAIPFVVQNYLVMSYIATNHNLSPLTSENDPLLNSLTVTNHPVLEFLHVNFGYHVEHHLFPTINGRNIKAVHYELAKQFPEEYKIMPKMKAIRALYQTARIYKTAHVLINPETGDRYPTI